MHRANLHSHGPFAGIYLVSIAFYTPCMVSISENKGAYAPSVHGFTMAMIDYTPCMVSSEDAMYPSVELGLGTDRFDVVLHRSQA